ncbi:hypothetical protein JQ580_33410 [Bradyrhizobium japonicum]|uniref:hypothetical protein n=1 Tax=Bradyrhizobium japonicum TaxID=375 RepID=UPI001BA54CD0|nr:hypothetical protein [Bradyrhizobium japonicum]MBR0995614.1 hypothetical protein [Bradyrhizobium japonicum]
MSRFSAPIAPLTTGALIGGGAIAGAVAASIANYRAALEADWSRLEAEQLRELLRYSELMRARDQITLGREIEHLCIDRDRAKRDATVATVRKLPR